MTKWKSLAGPVRTPDTEQILDNFESKLTQEFNKTRRFYSDLCEVKDLKAKNSK